MNTIAILQQDRLSENCPDNVYHSQFQFHVDKSHKMPF